MDGILYEGGLQAVVIIYERDCLIQCNAYVISDSLLFRVISGI